MKYKHNVDFNSQAISINNYDWIVKFVHRNNINSVVEFGPGSSTWAFNEKEGIKIFSYEYSPKWCDFYVQQFKDHPNIIIHPLNEFYVRKVDMVFVDSPKGRGRYSRLETCILGTLCSNLIVMHDAIRQGERETSSVMEALGWKYFLYEDSKKDRGLAVFSKRAYVVSE